MVQRAARPADPPRGAGGSIRAFKPSRRSLAYRKLYFWVGLTIFDLLLTIGWITIVVANPLVGALLFPVYLAVAVVPDVLAYIAIHLRYDTTWYVMSERSLRIRRGIWIIHETTITYENIQNVGVLHRALRACGVDGGIADQDRLAVAGPGVLGNAGQCLGKAHQSLRRCSTAIKSAKSTRT